MATETKREGARSDDGAPRARDAQRSRSAILDAAERVFAARGYDAASLGEIAAEAKLSRGTPSYFFGSKEGLYQAVLERAFAERERATAAAFGPLRKGEPVEHALRQAVEGYLAFLLDHPSFVRLIEWEELAGGKRLRRTPRESKAMTEAFAVLEGGFDVDDAVLVFVSLTFSPLTQRSTFMAALRRDLGDDDVRERHVKLVVDQVMRVVAP
jgi:TetR/AcrR family transcriptional regulator